MKPFDPFALPNSRVALLDCSRMFSSHFQTKVKISTSPFAFQLDAPFSRLSWTSSPEVVEEVSFDP